MRIEVRTGHSADELRSLHGWLRDEASIRRTASLRLEEEPPAPGQMGTVIDALSVVTQNGWSAASFVLALVAWKQSRPAAPEVTIRRGDVVVTLTHCSSDEVDRAVRLLDQSQVAENPSS
jgi:hypothetical protein